jgi:hypothetical protein
MLYNRDREWSWDPDHEAAHLPQLTECDLGEYKEGAGGQQEVVEGLGAAQEAVEGQGEAAEAQGVVEDWELGVDWLVDEVDVWELHLPLVGH